MDMDIARDIRRLAALLDVVERRQLDGPALVALIAAYPKELPKYAHDLAI